MDVTVTILGCGSSSGVPLIGNNWGACDPANPRNRRTRVSVMVQAMGTSILIDTSPDLRQQMLDNSFADIHAVLYTHDHADHTHGIDELRAVNWHMGCAIPVYADHATMTSLSARFPYIFTGKAGDSFYKPAITPRIIETYGTAMDVCGVPVTPFRQEHGKIRSLGYRIGSFAYSTDVNELDEEAFAALSGVKVWVVDCVREEPHPTHAHLEKTLSWIERLKPEQAYLTHMNHTLDYTALTHRLPQNVAPAYDGLRFTTCCSAR